MAKKITHKTKSIVSIKTSLFDTMEEETLTPTAAHTSLVNNVWKKKWDYHLRMGRKDVKSKNVISKEMKMSRINAYLKVSVQKLDDLWSLVKRLVITAA